MSESVVAEVPDTRLMNIFHDVPNRPLLHYRFRPKTCGHAGGGGTRSHWDHGQCPCVPKECGHKYEWNHPYDEQMTLHKPPFSVLDRGKVVNVGRGKFTSYRVGDATNYSKDIHPEYCKKLFSKHYHRNGSLWHPGGVAGTDSDHKLLDLKNPELLHSYPNPIRVLKEPKSGGELHKIVNRATGTDIVYRQRNAVVVPKQVDPCYCCGLFDKKYYKDGIVTHPLENNQPKFGVGMEVIALWNESIYFFLGKITEIYEKTADVKFYNGHRQLDQLYRYIIPNKRSFLKVGDYVMANILNEKDQDCWIPGRVKSIEHQPDGGGVCFFKIQYYNGEIGENTNDQLIKISKSQYQMFIDYIMAKLAEPIKSKKKVGASDSDMPGFDLARFIMFSVEYRQLRLKYQPLLEPISGPNSLGTIDASPIPQSNSEIETLLERRHTLCELKSGETALARSPHDGLFYECKIEQNLQNGKYRISGDSDRVVNREDLISKTLVFTNQLKPQIGTKVVARHPLYRFGHAPGELIKMPSKVDPNVVIRFFDLYEGVVTPTDVYVVSHWKLHSDINTIRSIEKREKVMNEIREGLSSLSDDEKVLAKWPDDGWYYPSVVKSQMGNNEYLVERYPDNNLKSSKIVKREDIVSQSELAVHTSIGSTVLARHPTFWFAYVPGEIVRAVDGDSSASENSSTGMIVRLADLSEHNIKPEDLYALNDRKLQYDIEYIKGVELKWTKEPHTTCLAYNFDTRQAEPAVILKRGRNNRIYDIKYTNTDQLASQYAYLIFLNRKLPPSAKSAERTVVSMSHLEGDLSRAFATALLGNKLK